MSRARRRGEILPYHFAWWNHAHLPIRETTWRPVALKYSSSVAKSEGDVRGLQRSGGRAHVGNTRKGVFRGEFQNASREKAELRNSEDGSAISYESRRDGDHVIGLRVAEL